MSEEFELAKAMMEQADAIRQANQIKAAELSYNGQERSRSNKINTMIQAINMAIKLKSDRSMEDAIADAEKLIAWFDEGSCHKDSE